MILPAGNVSLALLSALLWGAGDFSGGSAVRVAGGGLPAALRVLVLGYLLSLGTLVALALLLHQPFLHGAPVIWALLAGPVGAVAILCFYLALAAGSMGPSAALSGLLAATIPAIASAWLEGAPGLLRLLGFVLAALAIGLIAATPTKSPHPESRRVLLLATLAGAGFGVYFVLFRMAAAGGLLWPMALCRTGSLATVVTFGLVRRFPLRPTELSRAAVRWILPGAFFDTSGSLAFMAATRAGRLDVASVLASLYPASTILLAAWLLHERPARRQALGMLLALAAVILVTR